MERHALLSFFLSLALLPPPGARAQSASFERLGDLPGGTVQSSATSVSADGAVVVGTGTTADGRQAFRWTSETGIVALGNVAEDPFKESWAYHVSPDGKVVVGSGDPGEGWEAYRGFVWTAATGMVEHGDLGAAPRHEVFSASNDGTILVGDGGSQAFRWSLGAGLEMLGVLTGRTHSRAVDVSDDGSVIVGSSYQLPAWTEEQAFRWTREEGMIGLGFLPNSTYSMPNAVSPDGTVVVGTSQTDGTFPAFSWTKAGGMVRIGHLDGKTTTHPFDVSRGGAVIVGASFADRGSMPEAFLWDPSHGMRSLQRVLETTYGLELEGWTLQAAGGVTPDGNVIVGWGTNPDGQQEAFRVVLHTPLANAVDR